MKTDRSFEAQERRIRSQQNVERFRQRRNSAEVLRQAVIRTSSNRHSSQQPKTLLRGDRACEREGWNEAAVSEGQVTTACRDQADE